MPPLSHSPISRRSTLAGLAGGAALTVLPLPLWAQVDTENPVFSYGVASGDPDAVSVVLWTHVSGDGDIEVEWELAETPDFTRNLKSGRALAGAQRDHTVKVLAQGLQPGGTYYYRFRAKGVTSPVGRARTLPEGRLDRLGIALASCSNYAFGFFNAYEVIARDANVDFVLHTGDYIYEYGADEWGGDIGKTIGRVHEPANEIVSLADYRQRHAQYKADAGSKAMHAAHTLIACWDDHESANNPWTGGAQNHQPETEGDWNTRRDASIRAYFEWLPMREPEWLAQKGRSRMQFWRSYSFGDLATLCTIETRHTARTKQIDYLEYVEAFKSKEDVARFRREVLGQPGRHLLSPELEADLSAALTRSVKGGQPWRMIGNPMPIARTDVPDVVGLGILPDPSQNPDANPLAKFLAWKGKWNLPFYPDTWDGYPWARERLYDLSREAGAGDLVFLTGDSHSFWANRLADDRGRPAGIELGTAGISSPGDFMDSGFGPELSPRLDQAFADHVDEVLWTDNMNQGYVRIELERDSGRATFIAVDTVLSRNFRPMILRRFDFARKNGVVDYI